MAIPQGGSVAMPISKVGGTTADRQAAVGSTKRGLGLQAKLTLFLVAMLLLMALVSGVMAALILSRQMTEGFRSKGEAIVASLATGSVEVILDQDLSTLQARIDQFVGNQGVAYVLVYDRDQNVLADTFSPFLPEGLVGKNIVPPDGRGKAETIEFTDPETGRQRHILDIGEPVLAGQLGTVRVGMDLDLIASQARRSVSGLLGLLLGLTVVTGLLAFLISKAIVRPVNELVVVARRVGDGDLTTLAKVRSKDEIGVLGATFNEAILRLRGQVQTEEERDDERRRRQDLQGNISEFLGVATRIAGGDLRLRGQVTSDVLGNVVDAINVMVEEIGFTLAGVRQTADTVYHGAQEMISAADQVSTATEGQTAAARQVDSEVSAVTAASRTISERAQSSADAARETARAADAGLQAVTKTQGMMESIRGEVQRISKRIKSLGDRSLEISEIVETISQISGQTNLLALNAAIEASGAGEYGSRFAVVAGEVRKLAEDSAKAAKRVEGLISSVQGEVQDAVFAMEDGTREVEAGYRVATEAGSLLKEISRISSGSTRLADQISDATQVQAKSVENVAQAVSAMTEISAQAEDSARGGRQSAERLLLLSQQLTERLSRFQLPETPQLPGNVSPGQ